MESANKLVVEDRLKGSGMHWERSHVDPMLALRNVVANDRWDEAWPQIEAAVRAKAWEARRTRQQPRRQDTAEARPDPPPVEGAVSRRVAPTPSPPPPAPGAAHPATPRPAADHPWRHSPVGKARYQPWRPYDPPKS